MRIQVFKSYSEVIAVQIAGKFSNLQEKYIEITEDDYSYVLGDMNSGKALMIDVAGSEECINEYMSIIRLKKADKMIVRICASSKVTMKEIDRVAKLFNKNAYYCISGIAFSSDIARGDYIIDAVMKYEPQDDLRLD